MEAYGGYHRPSAAAHSSVKIAAWGDNHVEVGRVENAFVIEMSLRGVEKIALEYGIAEHCAEPRRFGQDFAGFLRHIQNGIRDFFVGETPIIQRFRAFFGSANQTVPNLIQESAFVGIENQFVRYFRGYYIGVSRIAFYERRNIVGNGFAAHKVPFAPAGNSRIAFRSERAVESFCCGARRIKVCFYPVAVFFV